MKKQLTIMLCAGLITASIAACSGNRADEKKEDSTGQSLGIPPAADSALKTNSKPVDTAAKDTAKMRDTVRR